MKDRLSRANITSIAVPFETLEKLKELADREGRIQYRIIQDALELYAKAKVANRKPEG